MAPTDPARSFGPVADVYDRGRPDYPADAVRWLVAGQARSVVELGAGTGKLTAGLVGAGHDVLATEPDPGMLEVLRRRLPETRTALCAAEEIAAEDRSADVVVCAQAFHWFDHERALPEIARVLKPGGHLALVWNERDERIPWVRRLGAIIGSDGSPSDPRASLDGSGLFGGVDEATYAHWQQVDRDSILDLTRSRSYVAVLDDAAREAKLEEVRAFYADYGRGMDGMRLPYRSQCYRAPVLERAEEAPSRGPGAAEEPAPARVTDDTEMLLIDFR